VYRCVDLFLTPWRGSVLSPMPALFVKAGSLLLAEFVVVEEFQRVLWFYFRRGFVQSDVSLKNVADPGNGVRMVTG
jgi:hypothetical protein